VLDRGEGHVDMGRVVHHQDDAGDDLQHQVKVSTMPQIHIQLRFLGVGIMIVS
jgi:hypothetical protein